jgi:dipeptide/tripeptide permease
LIIFAAVVLFWMAFKQNAGTFNLWFRNHTERTPGPWLTQVLKTTHLTFLIDPAGNLGEALSASINPLFVILFSPLMVWFWLWLRRRSAEPSTPTKVLLGMLLTAVAFLIMAIGGWAGGDTDRVTGLYLTGAYAVLTLGELCLSPMGLSLVSKLAAPKYRSTWMGGWFAATAIGGYLSGALAGWWEVWPHSGFFLLLVGTSLLAALFLGVFLNFLRAAMPVETQKPPEVEPTETPVEEATSAS